MVCVCFTAGDEENLHTQQSETNQNRRPGTVYILYVSFVLWKTKTTFVFDCFKW